jgi:hypothetical protein
MKAMSVLGTCLLVGSVLFAVGYLFYILNPVLVPSIPKAYKDHPELFRPWPWPGWTQSYMIFHPFGYGFVFVVAFMLVRDAGRQDRRFRGTAGGAAFGALVFLVGSLPVFLMVYASMRVPEVILASWVVQNLAQYTAAGALLGCVTDGATVQLATRLSLSADSAWERLKRKNTFLYVTRGMVGYSGAESWPDELFRVGATIPMRVRLFHLGLATPHEVQVVRVDEAVREIETEERNGSVRSWRHRMRVEPVSDSHCRYVDRIEIDAGLLTPLVWAFAFLFYKYRQARWRRLPFSGTAA